MVFRLFNRLIVLGFLFFAQSALAQTDTSEAHTMVVMRTIGHEILLSTGNDSSIVLPVEKVDGRYKIQFEHEFTLEPMVMASAVQKVVKKTSLANKYRVEVEMCDSQIVLHAFEIGVADSVDQIACATRLQSKECYVVYITLLRKTSEMYELPSSLMSGASTSPANSNNRSVWTMISIVIALSVLLFFASKKMPKKDQSHIISLGKYQFNQRKMLLILKSSETELTSKEADLLSLLHRSANKTVEREEILQKVWGDEGDYVGRTLDVFISKLRKKLVADDSVKIVNVRGVGYKLILDN